MNISCGKLINCWDLQKRPCIRNVGHEGGCNPFSKELPFEKATTKKKPALVVANSYQGGSIAV